MFGRLDVPGQLLDPTHARHLLGEYLSRDKSGLLYSGAAFDLYPDPLLPGSAYVITDSDLVAVALLGTRTTGHEALAITRDRVGEIRRLLEEIPAHASIEGTDADRLLHPDGPAWQLWTLLRDIRDRTKDAALGPVAAGKLLARKRPGLIPISDSRTAKSFARPNPGADRHWWADVRSAALDPSKSADGYDVVELPRQPPGQPECGPLVDPSPPRHSGLDVCQLRSWRRVTLSWGHTPSARAII